MAYGESNGDLLDDVVTSRVRSFYSELITYCYSTLRIDKNCLEI